MKSLNDEEANILFMDLWRRRAPLRVIFVWGGPEAFNSVIKGVGERWISLAMEGKNDLRLELPEGTSIKERYPSEAPLEHRGSSTSKYERLIEISLAFSATCLIFEMKLQ
jgi:hypothetical protein